MVVEATNLDTLKQGNVLVDFYSTTCGPCRTMNPILDEVSKEIPEVRVVKVEVTKCPGAAQTYGVRCLPTVMFLQNAKVREIAQGLTTKKNLVSMVHKHMIPAMA
jgi:thioredoxin 1